MTSTLGARWLGLLLLVLMVSATARAETPPMADRRALVARPPILGATYMLRDPDGTVTLDDVIRRDAANQLVRVDEEIALGWTRDAVWVRFDVFNEADHPVFWLLELAYPHLDRVDLYALRGDGRRMHRVAGDHLPFDTRDLAHPNLIFEQNTLGHEHVRYYLRARSEGSVRVPLRAWRPKDFVTRDAPVSALLWMFYGALIVMAWYNLCVGMVIRSREHVYLASLLLSFVATLASLSGQMFQYVLPNLPSLANRVLMTSIALAVLCTQLYVREVLRKLAEPPRIVRAYPYSIPFAVLLVALAMLLPPAVGQRVVWLGIAVFLPIGFVTLVDAHRLRDPQLRFSVFSFCLLLVGITIALLAYANVIPAVPLTLWAGHLGCAAYCVTASLALPVRLKQVSARLAMLNAQLSSNVDDLKVALGRAERATEDARRATLVKDEFMATMSHELRTPLNAIINVPQGLLEDFPSVRAATCGACGSRFVLDPGDVIEPTTSCPDCSEVGTLRADTITQYLGKPAHTARFLAKIERSGRHLLQMVNGVLDFSKMEAGRLELSLEPLDVAKLLHETTDELIDVARSRGLDIKVHLANDEEPGLGDPVRLRQVLLNLLSNAIKFSDSGSIIDVFWKRDPDNDVISVKDRGIGIAPEDHSRVFASFEQVHKGDTRKYGGTGLGLSISRSLVRMHGGELWVESRLGEGATFTFRIPRANATISDRAQERSQIRPAPPPPASSPSTPSSPPPLDSPPRLPRTGI
ncbi:MAG: 7TM-DISM domain-containing protein [Polyangiales bacterium]